MRDLLRIVNGFVRPTVLITLTGILAYLALVGHERAIEALIGQTIAVVSYFFGERAGSALPQQAGHERE